MANFSGMLNNYNLTVNVFASIDFSYIRRYARKIKKTPERCLAYIFLFSLCWFIPRFRQWNFLQQQYPSIAGDPSCWRDRNGS